MTAAYSSSECPETLTITGTSCWASHLRGPAQKASTPGFCRPMLLSMPLGVSAMRGESLPAQGSRETPLVVTAPRVLRG